MKTQEDLNRHWPAFGPNMDDRRKTNCITNREGCVLCYLRQPIMNLKSSGQEIGRRCEGQKYTWDIG